MMTLLFGIIHRMTLSNDSSIFLNESIFKRKK